MGVPVHLAENYADWVIMQLRLGLGTHVVTLNAEMVMQAEQNPALAEIIRRAELVIPDGAGVVLFLRLKRQSTDRCPGIELAETLLRRSITDSDPSKRPTFFFFGGKPGISQAAAARWQQELPGVAIAGTQHGYLTPEQQVELQQTLQSLQPSAVFVGLGVPRQEFWIAEHRHLCPQSIWIGVGGSFDIWSGEKSRAPGWLRNNHLEWVYRLYQEPWRWYRMLALPKFAWKAILSQIKN
jgi:N-acetylglucosaminyldiphosphoundecaprenol N-acetyl-beta-D-mannosaminyltransferase